MSARLLKPDLYTAGDSQVTLRGGRCVCGYQFFPMQRFGCERCGRSETSLQPVALCGKGKVIAACVVHAHGDKRRATPFVVGAIALDEGPIVRALMVGETDFEPGANVEAVLVPIALDDQTQALDLRFQLSSRS